MNKYLLLLSLTWTCVTSADPVIIHGHRQKPMVALTFDACPTIPQGQFEPLIIDTLIETSTPATLFISGRWAKNRKDIVKELAANPLFEIANHTYSHPHLTEKKEEEIFWELDETQKILKSITGVRPKYFRPPFGEYNDLVVKVASQLGLTTVEYDLAAGDSDPDFTKDILTDYVVKRAKKGSIVVMHMNKKGIYTGEALRDMITRLKERGFKLVKVSELSLP